MRGEKSPERERPRKKIYDAPVFKTLITREDCVHYCSVGGHLWDHPTQKINGVNACPYLEDTPEAIMLGEDKKHKFFVVCDEHERRKNQDV